MAGVEKACGHLRFMSSPCMRRLTVCYQCMQTRMSLQLDIAHLRPPLWLQLNDRQSTSCSQEESVETAIDWHESLHDPILVYGHLEVGCAERPRVHAVL